MTSRRPMTRSFSGNGKTGGEEENGSSNSRSESRNPYLSNVRPENSYSRYSHYRPTRSTLCSVMAQLTEDIQPSYETTLKSKAVSENCNVKFSCVVSGYPEPELTWYKDDMEMDRYCGLPKYEIRRNGKTHSLHIFNCTLDDAAIYQASASNTKGIVSCSGVLEVGTMNEYKIHQRFFAKLKQKAENKRREMEESRKKGKENIQQQQQPENSPQRPQRKRLVPPQENPRPLQENPESTEKLQGTASEPNRVVADVKEEAPENGVETVETARILPEGCLATKKIKISSDLDGVSGSRSSTGSRGHLMGNGGENSYDGGMGLAQFLAETLSSQAAEEKQSSAREERAAEKDTSGPEVVKDVEMTKEGECEEAKEKEKQLAEACEREKQRVEQLAIERGRQSELPQNTGHAKHVSDTKSHSKGHKDHEHHHIQASISSVLHSVKDFFFGKSRKDPHEHKEKEYRDVSEPSTPSPGPTPPPRRPQLQTQRYSGERERLQLEKVEVPVEAVAAPQPPVSLEQFTPQEHKGEVGLLQTQDVPGEQLECAGSSSEPGAEEAMELSTELSTEVSMEVSMDVHSSDLGEATSMSWPQVLTKDEEEDLQTHSVPSTQQEPAVSLPVSGAEAQTSPPAGPPQSQAAHKDASSAASGFSSGESRSFVRTISETNSRGLGELPHETLHDKALHVDISGERYEHKVQENNSASDLGRQGKFEEKAEEPCEDNAMWSTPSAEEQIDVCDSTQTNQTPVTPLKEESEMESDDAESARLKEVDNTAPAQETNREFPATVSVERSENCDLEIQQESVTTAVESVQRADLRADQSSNITPKQNKDEGEKDDKVKASLNVKTEEQEQQRREVQSLTAQRGSGKEGESLVEVAESDELNSELKRLEEQSERGVVLPSEEQQQVASKPIGTDRHVSGFIEKDAPDTRADIPLILLNDHFMTANSGEPVEEADSRESDLPVRTLTLSDPKSEPPTSIDIAAGAVEVPLPDQRVAGGSPSMQSNVQADENLPLAHNVQEVAQHEDKTEMQKTEPVLQVDFESIPVISVSCMDEEEVCVPMPVSPLQTWQPDEAPTEPLPVVPPISISCNDCPPESHLPSPKHYTETESLLAAVLDKTVLLSDKTVELDKTQRGKHNPEAATLCTLANTSSVLSALTHTHVTSRVISSGETPDVSDVSVPETCNVKPLPADPPVEELHPDRPSAEWLEVRPSTLPPLSPSSLRRFLSRTAPGPDGQTTAGDTPGERAGEELSGGSTPTSSLSCESSPRLKRRDSLTLIRSATPEELASGARRKIFMTKAKGEDGEGAGVLDPQGKRESPYMSPGQARRALLQGTGQNTPPMERRSPLVSRRKAPPDVPKAMEEIRKDEPAGARTEEKEKDNLDPFKAPQVIRKIRGEPFPDATGHLKLWCQFFNVLSHSTVKWFRDDEEIVEVTKSGGDESQVALVIVQASGQDCGVYGCTIRNEYGTDTTDFLLSTDILSEILLKDDLEVGEEIEMTPLLFSKGLADSGCWGEKFFGRIITTEVCVGQGCSHKASRVKAIYGLDPVFESGSTCIVKVRSPIAYGTKQENSLSERNREITKQECKIQNMIREYCKIFAAEARVVDNFGVSLEVVPQYLMYRPANSVPYATVESDLGSGVLRYCTVDASGQMVSRTSTELEQKSSTFQHWIHQWTHGNLLVTQMEGVGGKITNVRAVSKSKGYQGLTESGSPKVFDHFLVQHQCNYYCGLLGLRPLKTMDSLQQPPKGKGSRSPLLGRKLGSGSSSPQLGRKMGPASSSPQAARRSASSPKVTRKGPDPQDPEAKAQETG